MYDFNHPSRMPSSGGDNRGFWLEMLGLFGALGLIALFRHQLEAAAAHPRQAIAMLTALEQTALQDSLREIVGIVPVAGGVLAVVLIGVVLVRRWWAGPVGVPRGGSARSPLRLGRHRGSRRTFAVPRAATFDHALILGRTRSGKSQHAVSLALQDLDRGDCALVLLDPHDALCRSFVASGYDALQNRPVTWLSFGDGPHVPGFDLLERGNGESPSAVAERLGDLVDWLFFAGESTDHERLTNNLRLAAWACASLGRSLLDCRTFLTDPRHRALARTQLADPYLLEGIRGFEETLRHDPTFAQSAVNRLANLTDNEALRRIVGQPTSFDLGALLDQRGILLVSLDEVALGEKGVYLLAGMLLHRIAWHLKRRAKDDAHRQNVKARILLDEAQRYQVGLLQGMVGELAGRGASVGLITQGLTQVADPRLRSFLLNNVATYSIFTVSDQEAELIAKELFEARANRVGIVDERGRPAHVLAIAEQLAEHKRVLTRQDRRDFVAFARGTSPTLCQSFEVRPQVPPAVVEAFRRRCAARAGRPNEEVERMLRERLRQARAEATRRMQALRDPAEADDAGKADGGGEHARSKKPGFAERARRDRSSGQLDFGDLETGR